MPERAICPIFASMLNVIFSACTAVFAVFKRLFKSTKSSTDTKPFFVISESGSSPKTVSLRPSALLPILMLFKVNCTLFCQSLVAILKVRLREFGKMLSPSVTVSKLAETPEISTSPTLITSLMSTLNSFSKISTEIALSAGRVTEIASKFSLSSSTSNLFKISVIAS